MLHSEKSDQMTFITVGVSIRLYPPQKTNLIFKRMMGLLNLHKGDTVCL